MRCERDRGSLALGSPFSAHPGFLRSVMFRVFYFTIEDILFGACGSVASECRQKDQGRGNGEAEDDGGHANERGSPPSFRVALMISTASIPMTTTAINHRPVVIQGRGIRQ